MSGAGINEMNAGPMYVRSRRRSGRRLGPPFARAPPQATRVDSGPARVSRLFWCEFFRKVMLVTGIAS